jgi:hypothetical protein
MSTTAQRLMDVAEKLFAEHGNEGTTLRAVVDAAGVNLSSVKSTTTRRTACCVRSSRGRWRR